jgi:hypothetical protein
MCNAGWLDPAFEAIDALYTPTGCSMAPREQLVQPTHALMLNLVVLKLR